MKEIKQYETLAEAGYRYVMPLGNGEHVLHDDNSGCDEIWFCNKNHASYGLIWGNTHLEFARSWTWD